MINKKCINCGTECNFRADNAATCVSENWWSPKEHAPVSRYHETAMKFDPALKPAPQEHTTTRPASPGADPAAAALINEADEIIRIAKTKDVRSFAEAVKEFFQRPAAPLPDDVAAMVEYLLTPLVRTTALTAPAEMLKHLAREKWQQEQFANRYLHDNNQLRARIAELESRTVTVPDGWVVVPKNDG